MEESDLNQEQHWTLVISLNDENLSLDRHRSR